jgi:hypothetical protein
LRRDAAVNLDVDLALADHSLQPRDLVHRRLDEGLAAEARIDGHHEDEVEPLEHISITSPPLLAEVLATICRRVVAIPMQGTSDKAAATVDSVVGGRLSAVYL